MLSIHRVRHEQVSPQEHYSAMLLQQTAYYGMHERQQALQMVHLYLHRLAHRRLIRNRLEPTRLVSC